VNNLRALKSAPASLIISHDVDMVRHADYAYLLKEGSIVARGHPNAILNQEHVWGDLLSTKRAARE